MHISGSIGIPLNNSPPIHIYKVMDNSPPEAPALGPFFGGEEWLHDFYP
ncbi:hypothetical protein P872_14260 [Rhodonellum psychrophilum GCM71 = DSM 17998]|uniref:Uncharacterized protein n=1 Tax=Rhodonellum psychrophilum GCM71 = DSM 17998 TaxID=1123057 RepID=U5BUG5_9BACT|nr:hypothetical protein P872_14260 [Rhodonellum psychrophilum GCM71 = DSM 17998]